MPAIEHEAWIARLDEFEVRYVLVGGYAAVLHGASRPTLDIDVVPEWTEPNLIRLCDALKASSAVSISGPTTSGAAITPEVLVDREVMTWQTDLGRIDTLVGIPDGNGEPVDYDALLRHAIRGRVGPHLVVVASLDDVITSKEFAARAKDARALPELRRLRDRAEGR